MNKRVLINDVEIKYGSLMEIDDRLDFFKVFKFETESKDNDQYYEHLSFLQHIQDKKIFFDVGSSYGVFGLTFSKNENTQVYSFDGSISAYLALYQTMMLNNINNLKHLKMMIGDMDGFVRVAYDEHQSLLVNNESINTIELIMKLDTISELFDVVPDCIKIDVEGAEYKVLMGSSFIIENYRPTLFMEVHPNFLKDFHGHSIYDIYNFFEKYEYKAIDLFGNEIKDYKKHLEAEKNDSNRTVWVQ
tara:strand:+ start:227 stop:964 length:738 start_codon:yes stop_codon:yes gene_type:complete